MDSLLESLTYIYGLIAVIIFLLVYWVEVKLDLPLYESTATNTLDNSNFTNISHIKLKRLIEKIIDETLRIPQLTDFSGIPPHVSSTDNLYLQAYERRQRNKHLNRRNSKSSYTGDELSYDETDQNNPQFFDPKRYQELLATAVLNKIVDVCTSEKKSINENILENINNNLPNVAIKTEFCGTPSSSSSNDPRSDSSFTDPGHNGNLSDVNTRLYLDALNENFDRESVMSESRRSHKSIQDIISSDNDSVEDFVSVASGADSTWEENWLFKKRKLMTHPSAPVSMLVPAPKEDIKAMIGDKSADEISDFSENEIDDDSNENKNEAENDRIQNRTVIGGQNTAGLFDDLAAEPASLVSKSSISSENNSSFIETKNDYVDFNYGLNVKENPSLDLTCGGVPIKTEAVNPTVKIQLEDGPGNETSNNDLRIPEISTENDMNDQHLTVDNNNSQSRRPSVIEFLAAIALGPVLTVGSPDFKDDIIKNITNTTDVIEILTKSSTTDGDVKEEKYYDIEQNNIHYDIPCSPSVEATENNIWFPLSTQKGSGYATPDSGITTPILKTSRSGSGTPTECGKYSPSKQVRFNDKPTVIKREMNVQNKLNNESINAALINESFIANVFVDHILKKIDQKNLCNLSDDIAESIILNEEDEKSCLLPSDVLAQMAMLLNDIDLGPLKDELLKIVEPMPFDEELEIFICPPPPVIETETVISTYVEVLKAEYALTLSSVYADETISENRDILTIENNEIKIISEDCSIPETTNETINQTETVAEAMTATEDEIRHEADDIPLNKIETLKAKSDEVVTENSEDVQNNQDSAVPLNTEMIPDETEKNSASDESESKLLENKKEDLLTSESIIQTIHNTENLPETVDTVNDNISQDKQEETVSTTITGNNTERIVLNNTTNDSSSKSETEISSETQNIKTEDKSNVLEDVTENHKNQDSSIQINTAIIHDSETGLDAKSGLLNLTTLQEKIETIEKSSLNDKQNNSTQISSDSPIIQPNNEITSEANNDGKNGSTHTENETVLDKSTKTNENTEAEVIPPPTPENPSAGVQEVLNMPTPVSDNVQDKVDEKNNAELPDENNQTHITPIVEEKPNEVIESEKDKNQDNSMIMTANVSDIIEKTENNLGEDEIQIIQDNPVTTNHDPNEQPTSNTILECEENVEVKALISQNIDDNKTPDKSSETATSNEIIQEEITRKLVDESTNENKEKPVEEIIMNSNDSKHIQTDEIFSDAINFPDPPENISQKNTIDVIKDNQTPDKTSDATISNEIIQDENSPKPADESTNENKKIPAEEIITKSNDSKHIETEEIFSDPINFPDPPETISQKVTIDVIKDNQTPDKTSDATISNEIIQDENSPKPVDESTNENKEIPVEEIIMISNENKNLETEEILTDAINSTEPLETISQNVTTEVIKQENKIENNNHHADETNIEDANITISTEEINEAIPPPEAFATEETPNTDQTSIESVNYDTTNANTTLIEKLEESIEDNSSEVPSQSEQQSNKSLEVLETQETENKSGTDIEKLLNNSTNAEIISLEIESNKFSNVSEREKPEGESALNPMEECCDETANLVQPTDVQENIETPISSKTDENLVQVEVSPTIPEQDEIKSNIIIDNVVTTELSATPSNIIGNSECEITVEKAQENKTSDQQLISSEISELCNSKCEQAQESNDELIVTESPGIIENETNETTLVSPVEDNSVLNCEQIISSDDSNVKIILGENLESNNVEPCNITEVPKPDEILDEKSNENQPTSNFESNIEVLPTKENISTSDLPNDTEENAASNITEMVVESEVNKSEDLEDENIEDFTVLPPPEAFSTTNAIPDKQLQENKILEEDSETVQNNLEVVTHNENINKVEESTTTVKNNVDELKQSKNEEVSESGSALEIQIKSQACKNDEVQEDKILEKPLLTSEACKIEHVNKSDSTSEEIENIVEKTIQKEHENTCEEPSTAENVEKLVPEPKKQAEEDDINKRNEAIKEESNNENIGNTESTDEKLSNTTAIDLNDQTNLALSPNDDVSKQDEHPLEAVENVETSTPSESFEVIVSNKDLSISTVPETLIENAGIENLEENVVKQSETLQKIETIPNSESKLNELVTEPQEIIGENSEATNTEITTSTENIEISCPENVTNESTKLIVNQEPSNICNNASIVEENVNEKLPEPSEGDTVFELSSPEILEEAVEAILQEPFEEIACENDATNMTNKKQCSLQKKQVTITSPEPLGEEFTEEDTLYFIIAPPHEFQIGTEAESPTTEIISENLPTGNDLKVENDTTAEDVIGANNYENQSVEKHEIDLLSNQETVQEPKADEGTEIIESETVADSSEITNENQMLSSETSKVTDESNSTSVIQPCTKESTDLTDSKKSNYPEKEVVKVNVSESTSNKIETINQIAIVEENSELQEGICKVEENQQISVNTSTDLKDIEAADTACELSSSNKTVIETQSNVCKEKPTKNSNNVDVEPTFSNSSDPVISNASTRLDETPEPIFETTKENVINQEENTCTVEISESSSQSAASAQTVIEKIEPEEELSTNDESLSGLYDVEKSEMQAVNEIKVNATDATQTSSDDPSESSVKILEDGSLGEQKPSQIQSKTIQNELSSDNQVVQPPSTELENRTKISESESKVPTSDIKNDEIVETQTLKENPLLNSSAILTNLTTIDKKLPLNENNTVQVNDSEDHQKQDEILLIIRPPDIEETTDSQMVSEISENQRVEEKSGKVCENVVNESNPTLITTQVDEDSIQTADDITTQTVNQEINTPILDAIETPLEEETTASDQTKEINTEVLDPSKLESPDLCGTVDPIEQTSETLVNEVTNQEILEEATKELKENLETNSFTTDVSIELKSEEISDEQRSCDKVPEDTVLMNSKSNIPVEKSQENITIEIVPKVTSQEESTDTGISNDKVDDIKDINTETTTESNTKKDTIDVQENPLKVISEEEINTISSETVVISSTMPLPETFSLQDDTELNTEIFEFVIPPPCDFSCFEEISNIIPQNDSTQKFQASVDDSETISINDENNSKILAANMVNEEITISSKNIVIESSKYSSNIEEVNSCIPSSNTSVPEIQNLVSENQEQADPNLTDDTEENNLKTEINCSSQLENYQKLSENINTMESQIDNTSMIEESLFILPTVQSEELLKNTEDSSIKITDHENLSSTSKTEVENQKPSHNTDYEPNNSSLAITNVEDLTHEQCQPKIFLSTLEIIRATDTEDCMLPNSQSKDLPVNDEKVKKSEEITENISDSQPVSLKTILEPPVSNANDTETKEIKTETEINLNETKSTNDYNADEISKSQANDSSNENPKELLINTENVKTIISEDISENQNLDAVTSNVNECPTQAPSPLQKISGKEPSNSVNLDQNITADISEANEVFTVEDSNQIAAGSEQQQSEIQIDKLEAIQTTQTSEIYIAENSAIYENTHFENIPISPPETQVVNSEHSDNVEQLVTARTQIENENLKGETCIENNDISENAIPQSESKNIESSAQPSNELKADSLTDQSQECCEICTIQNEDINNKNQPKTTDNENELIRDHVTCNNKCEANSDSSNTNSRIKESTSVSEINNKPSEISESTQNQSQQLPTSIESVTNQNTVSVEEPNQIQDQPIKSPEQIIPETILVLSNVTKEVIVTSDGVEQDFPEDTNKISNSNNNSDESKNTTNISFQREAITNTSSEFAESIEKITSEAQVISPSCNITEKVAETVQEISIDLQSENETISTNTSTAIGKLSEENIKGEKTPQQDTEAISLTSDSHLLNEPSNIVKPEETKMNEVQINSNLQKTEENKSEISLISTHTKCDSETLTQSNANVCEETNEETDEIQSDTVDSKDETNVSSTDENIKNVEHSSKPDKQASSESTDDSTHTILDATEQNAEAQNYITEFESEISSTLDTSPATPTKTTIYVNENAKILTHEDNLTQMEAKHSNDIENKPSVELITNNTNNTNNNCCNNTNNDTLKTNTNNTNTNTPSLTNNNIHSDNTNLTDNISINNINDNSNIKNNINTNKSNVTEESSIKDEKSKCNEVQIENSKPKLHSSNHTPKLVEIRNNEAFKSLEISEEDDQNKLIPGSIAEREHKKWYNAVEMPNNPYAPEALKERLNTGSQKPLDIPENISETAIKTPEEEIMIEAKLNPKKVDLSMYSRDYYVPTPAKRFTNKLIKMSPVNSDDLKQLSQTDSTEEELSKSNTDDKNNNDKKDVFSARLIEIQDTIDDESLDSKSCVNLKTLDSSPSDISLANSLTLSEDSDTLRIYNLNKQETILIPKEEQITSNAPIITDTPKQEINIKTVNQTPPETPKKPVQKNNTTNAKKRPTDLKIAPVSSQTITKTGRTAMTLTPQSFKFLHPKRKLIEPSQIIIQEQYATPPETPDRPAVEEDVVHTLPSVKALAKAFLLSSGRALELHTRARPKSLIIESNNNNNSNNNEEMKKASSHETLQVPEKITSENIQDENENSVEITEKPISPVLLKRKLKDNIAFFENLKKN